MKKRKGISIIDIIFAVLFMSVVLGVSVMVYSVSIDKSKRSEYKTVMTGILMNEIERMHSDDYDVDNQVLVLDKTGELKANASDDDIDFDPSYSLTVIFNKKTARLYDVKVGVLHMDSGEKMDISTKILK